jgi:hypothetical protein
MLESELPLVGGTIIEEAPQVAPAPTQAPPAPAGIVPLSAGPQMTVIGQEVPLSAPVTPPQISIAIAGQPVTTYELSKARLTIGRAENNDIVIDSRIVSRHHACLERTPGGYLMTTLPEAGNPVLFDGGLLPPHKAPTW